MKKSLKNLAEINKSLCDEIQQKLKGLEVNHYIPNLIKDTSWGYSIDPGFGSLIAHGFSDLLKERCQEEIPIFRQKVKEYGSYGLIQGQITAKALPCVIICKDKAVQSLFFQSLEIMRIKGTHTLENTFNALKFFLNQKDLKSATAYLILLKTVFSKNLSFKISSQLATIIPNLCSSFGIDNRLWQIEQIMRVLDVNVSWIEALNTGMENGLASLYKPALIKFIDTGLEKFSKNFQRGEQFFSLRSEFGIETYENLQTKVFLNDISHQLCNYIQARTGLSLALNSVSQLDEKFKIPPLTVCTDGNSIYLPDEIGRYFTKTENLRLYKCLLRLEASHFEFGTYDFDLDKYFERVGKNENSKEQLLRVPDLEHFFSLFKIPGLAEDLFNVFEQARITKNMYITYPGLVKNTLPLLKNEGIIILKKGKKFQPVFYLYLRLVLGIPFKKIKITNKDVQYYESVIDLFKLKIDQHQGVEASAELVRDVYDRIAEFFKEKKYEYIKLPFNRRFRLDLFKAFHGETDIKAKIIREQLNDFGIDVYQSDLRKRLINNNGILSVKDIKDLKAQKAKNPKISLFELENIYEKIHDEDPQKQCELNLKGNTYMEWDSNLGDYLPEHTRVLEKKLNKKKVEKNFYDSVLREYHGLLKSIRRSFEFLRPEGMTILRKWPEGDDFDYRALIDYAVDRKIKKTPSERFYIKRIKEQRDVAVFLLVDLSKSTGYKLPGTNNTVLELEKQAIVLFCEALKSSGDQLAIAGFSGLGPDRVFFFHVKDFQQNYDNIVKQKISSMSPYRSTRMGAAIRHASSILTEIPANVRLLIILSDGFPNDIDYKKNYAIMDSRRSISEARSKGLHVHGITVNMPRDTKLDDLFGKGKYNLISDVRELPDKLPGIYRYLTA